MTESVKKMFKEAKVSKDFRQDLKDVGEELYKPSIIWDDDTKTTYTAVYMGWKIGKGTYREEDYM